MVIFQFGFIISIFVIMRVIMVIGVACVNCKGGELELEEIWWGPLHESEISI